MYDTSNWSGSLQVGNSSAAGAIIKMYNDSNITTSSTAEGWSAIAYGGKADVELHNSAHIEINSGSGIEIGNRRVGRRHSQAL